jgi:hypothetical protein
MIFLVGLRRSGTNWLERIVRTHPDVVVIPGETYLFGRGVRTLQTQVRHALPDAAAVGSIYASRPSFLAAARAYCDAVLAEAAGAVDPDAFHIVERTPLHVFDLDLIGAVYPDARVVHIIRDGRDVARSVLSMDWGPQTVADAAREWRSGIAAAHAVAPALASYTEVRYEELLSDPATGIVGVFDALGLSAPDAVVAAAMQEWSMPFNTDPADPRIGHGKWAGTWSAEDERAFDDIAGDMLRDLGYGAAPQAGPAAAASARQSPALDEPAPTSSRRPLLRRRRPAAPAPATGNATAVAEAFLERLVALDFYSAAAMLSPDAQVRALTTDFNWAASGGHAINALVITLQSEVASWGRPDRTEVFPAADQVVMVVSHTMAGEVTNRVVVIEPAEGSVRRLLYLRLPFGSAERLRDGDTAALGDADASRREDDIGRVASR